MDHPLHLATRTVSELSAKTAQPEPAVSRLREPRRPPLLRWRCTRLRLRPALTVSVPHYRAFQAERN